jgi:quercetin dioxygenase-like cupin family protein
MPEARSALAVGPGEAKTVRSPIGGDVTYLARGEQTGRALTALDVAVPPGEGPPLHRHTREEEWVYVLEGTLRWMLGDKLTSAPAGSSVFIPRGLPHCFQNVGDLPARMLITFAPAGMEGFFDRLAELTEFDFDAFTRAAEEHGMEVVGPPLAESNPL